MNLFTFAPALERFAAAAGDACVALESDRCVRHWNQASACQLCVDGCPTHAIVPAPGGVALDPAACVQCGYCLHACPTGAFAGVDETARLLQAAAALLPCSALDLTCSCRPAEHADRGVDAILQAGNCLGTLGVAAYVGLAALGVKRVGVHLGACAGCAIGSLRSQITGVAARAATLTTMTVTVLDTLPDDSVRRPVHASHAPQYSRRSLLRRVMGSRPATTPTLPPLDDPPSNQKQPPLERRVLLHVLAHLPSERRTPAAYFPSFAADTTCTACQVCATVCPTGALSFEQGDNVFALHFAPLACTGCGLCTQLCAPGALRPASSLPYADADPIVLLSGQQKQCRRCRASFAGAGDLCPACSFRRQNPSGSFPRPGSTT
jgi:ferredoxin